MIKLEISVIAPRLNEMAAWLRLPVTGRIVPPDEFIRLFNENSGSYILRADNWARYHKTELSVDSVSAERLEGYNDGSFKASVIIDRIDISGAAKALGVPTPIAVIAAHMGERGISKSLNAVLKLNKRLISNEAVRQLKKRNMSASAVYGKVVFYDDSIMIKG
ncbi:MAG: hypothetical protein MSJ26_04240 [Oscillospiraceae bacterium]|nr:hypothetical protein [Oscillospiraceae bacterium]